MITKTPATITFEQAGTKISEKFPMWGVKNQPKRSKRNRERSRKGNVSIPVTVRTLTHTSVFQVVQFEFVERDGLRIPMLTVKA